MSFIRTIINKPLFKFSSLNGLSVVIKIGIGLVTSKVLALFIGPGGFAFIGNLRNFLSTVETISGLGFQSGTVKYISEKNTNEHELRKIISTVFLTLMGLALFMGLLLFIFSSYVNLLIFGQNNDFEFVFRTMALALPFYVANFIFVAIINGLGKFSKVVYVSMLGNIIGLVISVLLIWKYNTIGALLAVVVSPATLFFISYYYIRAELDFFKMLSWNDFDSRILKNLSSFTAMALVSGILGPIVFLAIRNKAINTLGVEQAGFWEAISRISTYYLMFLTSLLSVYFLPKLALAKTAKKTSVIFMSYFRNVLPPFFIVLVVLYFCRNLVIQILFSKEFQPVENLFLWQFVGDFFKAASLILGYQLLAHKMTRVFIITEIISLLGLYLFSVFLINLYGIEGVVMAHALNYFIYLMLLVIYFRKNIGLAFKAKS